MSVTFERAGSPESPAPTFTDTEEPAIITSPSSLDDVLPGGGASTSIPIIEAEAPETIRSLPITLALPKMRRDLSIVLKNQKTVEEEVKALQNLTEIFDFEDSTKRDKLEALHNLPRPLWNKLAYSRWVAEGAPTPIERARAGLEPFDGEASIKHDPDFLMKDTIPLISDFPGSLLAQLSYKKELELKLLQGARALNEIKDLASLITYLDTVEISADAKQVQVDTFLASCTDKLQFIYKRILDKSDTKDFSALVNTEISLDNDDLSDSAIEIPIKWKDKQTDGVWEKNLPPSWSKKSPIKQLTLLFSTLQPELKNELFNTELDAFQNLYDHPSTTRYQLKAVYKQLSSEVKETLEPNLTPPFIGYKLDSEVHKTQGAHLQFDPDTGDVTGCKFSVFAPNAKSVHLVVRDWDVVQPKENASGGIDYTVAASFAKTAQIVVIADDDTETKTDMIDNGDGTFSVNLPAATLATHIRYEMKTEEDPAKVITYSNEQAKGIPALRYSPMVKDEDTGIFSFTSASVSDGTCYQYEVEHPDGKCVLKQDPFGFGEGFANYGEHALPLANSGNTETRNFHYKNPTAAKAVLTAKKSDGSEETFTLTKNQKTGIFYLNHPTEKDVTYSLTVTLASGETKTSPIQANHCFNGVSIVRNTKNFKWSDDAWIAARDSAGSKDKPINVYELYPLLWKKIPNSSESTLTEMENQIGYFADCPKTEKALPDGKIQDEYIRGDATRSDSLQVIKSESGEILSVKEFSFDGSRRLFFNKNEGGTATKTTFDSPTYRTIAKPLITWCKANGYTQIELMGLLGHPDVKSMGYQVTGYFTPSSSLGSVNDLKHLINELHRTNIGVIIDHIPFHMASNDFGLQDFDGTPLYGAKGKNRMSDWDTVCFDNKKLHVKSLLLSSIINLIETYHVDGIRMDAVAHVIEHSFGRGHDEYERNRSGGNHDKGGREFIRAMHQIIQKKFPGVTTFAEDWARSSNVEGTIDYKSGLLDDGRYHRGLGFDQRWSFLHFEVRDLLSKPERLRDYNVQQRFISSLMILFANGGRTTNAFSHDEGTSFKGSWLSIMANHEFSYGSPEDLRRKQIGSYSHLFTLSRFLHSAGDAHFMGMDIGQRPTWDKHFTLKPGFGTKADRKLLERVQKEGISFAPSGTAHKDAWKKQLSIKDIDPELNDSRLEPIIHEELDWMNTAPNVLKELELAVQEDRAFSWDNIPDEDLTEGDKIAKMTAAIHAFANKYPLLQRTAEDSFIEEKGMRGHFERNEDTGEVSWTWPVSFEKKLEADETLRAWINSYPEHDYGQCYYKSMLPHCLRVSEALGFHLIATGDTTNNVISYMRVGKSGKSLLVVHHLKDDAAFDNYRIQIPERQRGLFSGATKIQEVFNTTKFLGHDAHHEAGKTYYNDTPLKCIRVGDEKSPIKALQLKIGRSATMVFELFTESDDA